MFFHNLLPRMRNGAKHLTYQLGHLFELVFCQYCQVVPFVVTHHVLAPPLVDGLVILGESIVQILSQAFMNNGQLACLRIARYQSADSVQVHPYRIHTS